MASAYPKTESLPTLGDSTLGDVDAFEEAVELGEARRRSNAGKKPSGPPEPPEPPKKEPPEGEENPFAALITIIVTGGLAFLFWDRFGWLVLFFVALVALVIIRKYG